MRDKGVAEREVLEGDLEGRLPRQRRNSGGATQAYFRRIGPRSLLPRGDQMMPFWLRLRRVVNFVFFVPLCCL